MQFACPRIFPHSTDSTDFGGVTVGLSVRSPAGYSPSQLGRDKLSKVCPY
ncbi:hypothetical protein [Trichocoleus sp. FACHB-46]|nr:hypothetical protein [Trichocoleus sp. FACHB-46]